MFNKSYSLSLSPHPLLTPTHSALTPTLSTSFSTPTLAHRPTVLPPAELPPAELPLQHSNSQHPHGPHPTPSNSTLCTPTLTIPSSLILYPGAPTPQHANPISPHLQHHNYH